MAKRGVFSGRTVAVVNDLSRDEQLYLYGKTRELKEAIRTGADLSRFKVRDKDCSAYLLFLEDSTRTRESFKNAAFFHGMRVNEFDSSTSSFNKKESLTDTVKMLAGYAPESVFVIRSKLEGVCRWLEGAVGAYADQAGFPRPAFVNAGDGKHEHPTQEFLDEFTFLEQMNWDRSRLHIALTGDLYHGRTVHSKVDGMKIFREVEVDLVAPEVLGMPAHYVRKMEANGFRVNKYESLDEYVASGKTAPIWYFTRLQLERMGDAVLERADALRKDLTFRKDMLPKVGEGTRFYHPLPRDRTNPTNPVWLDSTPLNGWDPQSVNGYYTRIALLSMLGGAVGDDFSGTRRQAEEYRDDFVSEAPVDARQKPEYKVGIKPVENGIVIDHVASGKPCEKIWDHIDKIRRVMRFNVRSSHGVFHSNSGGFKGIISIPDVLDLDVRDMKKLGAVAPGCTLNIVKDHRVTRKLRMGMPPRVYGFDNISCKNPACVSHPDHVEHIESEFIRSADNAFVCRYCEKPHAFEEIWDE